MSVQCENCGSEAAIETVLVNPKTLQSCLTFTCGECHMICPESDEALEDLVDNQDKASQDSLFEALGLTPTDLI